MAVIAENQPGTSAIEALIWRCQRLLVICLPISVLVGTNLPAFQLAGRTVYIGTNEILIPILFGFLLLQMVVSPRRTGFPAAIAVPAGLFTCVIGMSLLLRAMENGGSAIEGVIEIARWVEYLAIFFIILGLVESEEHLNRVMRAFVFCGVLNMGAALYQAATFNFGDARVYGLFVSAADREGLAVANPNVAGAIFMVFALYFGAAAICKQRRQVVSLLLLTAAVAAVFMTLSRSAMLGGAISAILLFLLRRSARMLFVGVVVAIVFVVALNSSEFLRDRLEDTFAIGAHSVAANSVATRFDLWGNAIRVFTSHPLFGVGYGEYKAASGGVTADNYYLEVLASTGVVGLAALLFMIAGIAAYLFRMKVLRGSSLYQFRLAFLSAFVGLLVANAFGGLFFNPRVLALFWIMIGVVVRGYQLQQQRERLPFTAGPWR